MKNPTYKIKLRHYEYHSENHDVSEWSYVVLRGRKFVLSGVEKTRELAVAKAQDVIKRHSEPSIVVCEAIKGE